MVTSPNDPPPRAAAPDPALPHRPITRRQFRFERDTLTFANELVWEYQADPRNGEMRPRRNERAPEYTHRCFVMARSVRQFYLHARFDPDQPVVDAPTYRALIRTVVRRSPRFPSPDREQVVVPGYDSLRAFSHAQTPLLKAECGPPWQSYFVWSHWRMVFPIGRRHQERVARRLVEAVRTRPPPVVHLFRFPRITINHALVLFGATGSGQETRFDAYDPNIPARPVSLQYDRIRRVFIFPATHYWGGGVVSVTEAYAGWPY